MTTRLKQRSYPRVKSLDFSLFSFPDFITVGCASVPLSDSVKNRGVTFDCHLIMKTHVSSLVRSANFELRRISSIRHHLSTDATKTIVSAFVLSRLDYCNSLLFGCPQHLLNKLQKVQNKLLTFSWEFLTQTTFLFILLLFIELPWFMDTVQTLFFLL